MSLATLLLTISTLFSEPKPIYCGPDIEFIGPIAQTDLELNQKNIPYVLDHLYIDTLLPFRCAFKDDIESLQFGRWSFFNLESRVFTDWKQYPQDATGVIGLYFFKDLTLLIDYPQRNFLIGLDTNCFEKKGYRFKSFAVTPLLYEGGVPYIEISFNGTLLRALLDTKCPAIIYRTNQGNSNAVLTINEKELGLFPVSGVDFCIPAEADLILGAPFFMRRPVVFDLKNNLVYFGKELVE